MKAKKNKTGEADTSRTTLQSGEEGTDKGKSVWLNKQKAKGNLEQDLHCMYL